MKLAFICVIFAFVHHTMGVTYHPIASLTSNPVVSMHSIPGADTTLPALVSLTGPTTYDCTNATAPFDVLATVTHSGAASVAVLTVYLTSTSSSAQFEFSLSAIGVNTYKSHDVGICLPAETFSVSFLAINSVGSALRLSATNLAAATQWSQLVVTAACAPVSITSLTLPATSDASCTGGVCGGTFTGTLTVPALPASSIVTLKSGTSEASILLSATAGNLTFDVSGDANAGFVPIITATFDANPIPIPGFIPTSGSWQTILVSANGNRNSRLYVNSDLDAAGLRKSTNVINGGADTTAPTCTSISYAQLAFNTTTTYQSVVITAACTDDVAGVGMAYRGILVQGTKEAGGLTEVSAFDGFNSAGVGTFSYLPPYYSGTFQVIGVVAIDKSGNTAFYGTCANSDHYGQLCPGGSSAASVQASFALIVMLLITMMM